MKKLALLILTISSVIPLTWVSSSHAAEFLGYTLVPKQATFYIIILGLIGASMAMVSALYGTLWLADLRKKRKAEVVKLTLGSAMGAAAQPAK